MIKNEDIVNFINNKAIDKNGILLLNYDDAKDVIELCEKNKIDVLGIDVFTLHENKIQPLSHKSIDFSSEFCKYSSPSDYLKQFYGDCNNQMFFEVII